MAPKTRMTAAEVAADLAEREVAVDNRSRAERREQERKLLAMRRTALAQVLSARR